MKLRILLVRFWRVIRALWNREVNSGVMAGRLLDIDEEYKKSVAEWNRELGASTQNIGLTSDSSALCSFGRLATESSGTRPEIYGNPRAVGYEWCHIGGVLDEWKLHDLVHGEYIATVYKSAPNVWNWWGSQFDSRDHAMGEAEKNAGLVGVPLRK